MNWTQQNRNELDTTKSKWIGHNKIEMNWTQQNRNELDTTKSK